jgi:hypothetical protein
MLALGLPTSRGRSRSLYKYGYLFLTVLVAFTALSSRVESFAYVQPHHLHSSSQLQRQKQQAIARLHKLCPVHARLGASIIQLHASPSPEDNAEYDNGDTEEEASKSIVDYSTEEILLRMHLMPQAGVTLEKALEKVQAYSQSFPFAAVLPVQPLMYLPTDAGGVEIKFLRKKTVTKSGMDGGLCFFIETVDSNNDDENTEDESNMIQVTVKRNSAGQSIRKMFAERLVVTRYVASLAADAATLADAAITDATDSTLIVQCSRPSPVTENVVRVTSLFHQWM